MEAIIFSALFGGLVSSLFTAYFFEQRERRTIMLEKCQNTYWSIFVATKKISELYDTINEIKKYIATGSISDSTITEVKRDIDKFYSEGSYEFLQRAQLAYLIKYYDSFFDDIADRYHEKSNQTFNAIVKVFDSIKIEELPELDQYLELYEEFGNLSLEFRDMLSAQIKTTMQPPFYERLLKHLKSIFYWPRQ